MGFEQLQQTIEQHRKRVSKAKYVEAKREAADELYPLLSALVEALDERITETEGQVAGLIEASLSVVQNDLATQIFGTLSLAAQLADAVEAGQDTGEIVPALREALKLTEEAVLDACPDEDEDEEDEDEDESDEDGDGDTNEEDQAIAAVENANDPAPPEDAALAGEVK